MTDGLDISLLPPGGGVLCAVSGGADSVYLLCRLCELRESLGLRVWDPWKSPPSGAFFVPSIIPEKFPARNGQRAHQGLTGWQKYDRLTKLSEDSRCHYDIKGSGLACRGKA